MKKHTVAPQASVLFDVPAEKVENTCKSCKHILAMDYGDSGRFFYCSLRSSNRTENGLLKIKCKTPACVSYEKRVGEMNTEHAR